MYQYCTNSTVETYDCIGRHFIGAKDSVRSFRKIEILEWFKFSSFLLCSCSGYCCSGYKESYRIKKFTDDAKFLIRYFADNIRPWCIDINFVTFILLQFMVPEFYKLGWHVIYKHYMFNFSTSLIDNRPRLDTSLKQILMTSKLLMFSIRKQFSVFIIYINFNWFGVIFFKFRIRLLTTVECNNGVSFQSFSIDHVIIFRFGVIYFLLG